MFLWIQEQCSRMFAISTMYGLRPAPFRRFAESRLVHTRGAGTNHKTGQVFFADGFDDLRLADLGAHVLIIFRVHDTRFMTDHFYDFLYIYRSCDVAAAMAHKYTNSLHTITSCIF